MIYYAIKNTDINFIEYSRKYDWGYRKNKKKKGKKDRHGKGKIFASKNNGIRECQNTKRERNRKENGSEGVQ